MRLGKYVYGASAIAMGSVGLVWDDFAVDWQHVPEKIAGHNALACAAALIELLAGVALFLPRLARFGAAALTAIFCVYVALWVPTVLHDWSNFFEELSAALGGAVLLGMLLPAGSAWSGRTRLLARVYGVCPVSFGLVHLLYLKAAAGWVPAWIPPSQIFWFATTAVCFLLSAIAILSGRCAALAAYLLTAMIMVFEVLVWIPRLVASPHDHFNWSGNVVCLVLGAAAWAVADALADQ